MPPSIHCHPVAFARFAAEIAGLERMDALVRAASAVTLHEFPQADADGVPRALEALSTRVRARCRSGSPKAMVAHLHAVLFDEEGFSGNTDDYYNTRNSYLPLLIETHRGIPVALSLLYVAIAEQVGLTARGINSPGHFLAAIHDGDDWMYVDVFNAGRVMNRDEVFQQIEATTNFQVERTDALLAPASHRQWLARILVNLQTIFLQEGRSDHRSAISELLSLVTNA